MHHNRLLMPFATSPQQPGNGTVNPSSFCILQPKRIPSLHPALLRSAHETKMNTKFCVTALLSVIAAAALTSVDAQQYCQPQHCGDTFNAKNMDGSKCCDGQRYFDECCESSCRTGSPCKY